MSIGGGRRVSTRTRVVLAAATLLAATVIAVAPEHGRDVAKATSSCPTGTGYGGNVTTDANSGVSAAGNGCVIIVHSGGTDVFVHTGALQTWTVPAGVTSIELHVIGAGGGGGLQNRGGSLGSIGGGGGYATGTLTVTPGDQYSIIVGKGGRHQCAADLATDDLATRRNFNFGGGAAGYGLNAWDCSWASGGGRSAVRTLTGTDDIITAGGGGGGGYDKGGGAGGGATGVAGTNTGYATGGGGGTQSAGGAGGVGEDGYAGDKYVGGPAGVSWGSPSEGGGGGGGYYGGGGGGNNAGGGGGSSFVGTARGLINGSTTAGSGRVPGAIAPVNSGAPTISGTANVGETLTATTGTWSGATTKSFAWQVSTDGGVTWNNISGATGSTYVVGVSGRIRVVETAQNYFGTTTANSGSTAAIVDTTLSALAVSAGTLDPVFSSGVFAYAVTVPYTTIALTVTPTRNHSSTTITVNATAVASGVASGSISLSVGSNTVTIVATNTGVSATTIVTVTRQAATAPGAPTISTVTGGQGRLTVAFTAPASDGGETITGYEYSRNSGTWTSIGAITSPFVITGLSDNTSYSIRLRALNSVGAGSASTAQSGTTSAATTTTTSASTTTTSTTTSTTVATTSTTTSTTTTAVPAVTTSLDPSATTAPQLPAAALVQATTPTFAPGALTARATSTTVSGAAALVTGDRPATTTSSPVATSSTTTMPPAPDTGGDGVAMVVDGQELPVDIDKIDGVIITSSGTLRASIAGVTSTGAVAPLDSDGNVRVGNKGRIRVGVEGFAPGSLVEVWLYSDPTRLGAVAVGDSGTARGDLAIPSSVKDGLHRAVLRGTSDRGATVQVAVSVVVGEPGGISPTGRALLVVALVIAALSALFLPAVLRRRRDDENEADLRGADLTS